jgi:plasmid maintenance system killer protein
MIEGNFPSHIPFQSGHFSAKPHAFDSYIDNRYTDTMVRSIKDQPTQNVFDGKNSKEAHKLDQSRHARGKRKLYQLNAAIKLKDLRISPGNLLEASCENFKGLLAFGSTISDGSYSVGLRLALRMFGLLIITRGTTSCQSIENRPTLARFSLKSF